MQKYAIPIGAFVYSLIVVVLIIRYVRLRWKRELVQLNGKSEQRYNHKVSSLLMQSYAEIGAFPHKYHAWESPCSTHYNQFISAPMLRVLYSGSALPDANTLHAGLVHTPFNNLGVSALEFDTKGAYLASVTRSRCLTLHKFESLCSQSNEFDEWKDEKKQLQHFPLSGGLLYNNSISAIHWNPSNQDEIAYTSLRSDELNIFDIGYSQEVQVLSKRPPANVFVSQGLSDIAFLNDGTRSGVISMWDRRASVHPQRVLATKKRFGLTSIQSLGDQCVYGASESGFVYIWDLRRLRGGRSSTVIQSDKEVHSSPLTSVNLDPMLNEVGPLAEQSSTYIRRKGIQSININSSCPYQLGFHLNDGWSGVLDMHNHRVSHIHCPPLPPWMKSSTAGFPVSPLRKPAWLPEHSIYAVASTSSNGLHLLDFYPHSSSPCHVDYDDSKSHPETVKHKQSVFVPFLNVLHLVPFIRLMAPLLLEPWWNASLLTISQKHLCKKGDGEDEQS